MKYKNVYFINGNAYAGKSTMVKAIAKKYNAILCEENYHNAFLDDLDPNEYPGLTYTRDLKDFRHFIRRSPDEYEHWIDITSKECEKLELVILEGLLKEERMIIVDTNISLEKLHEISDKDHVLIMLADPMISVNRFFERPDREKQFLYSEGRDCGGKCLWRKARQPGKQGNSAESRIEGGAITIASLLTKNGKYKKKNSVTEFVSVTLHKII